MDREAGMSFGVFQVRLEEFMVERGFKTAEELARAVNVTKSTGYNWIGGGMPRVDTLIRLADATDTNLDYWIGRTDYRARIASLLEIIASFDQDEL